MPAPPRSGSDARTGSVQRPGAIRLPHSPPGTRPAPPADCRALFPTVQATGSDLLLTIPVLPAPPALDTSRGAGLGSHGLLRFPTACPGRIAALFPTTDGGLPRRASPLRRGICPLIASAGRGSQIARCHPRHRQPRPPPMTILPQRRRAAAARPVPCPKADHGSSSSPPEASVAGGGSSALPPSGAGIYRPTGTQSARPTTPLLVPPPTLWREESRPAGGRSGRRPERCSLSGRTPAG